MPKIFISYRRADSAYFIGRVYDRLEATFGAENIFKDVENIAPGEDYRQVLADAVAWCDVMLVVIGPRWATITDDAGNKRLFQPNDYVRFEIEQGLARPNAVIIPLIVMDASIPTADALPATIGGLVFRNSLPVRGDPDFNRDVRVLIRYLKEIDSGTTQAAADSPGFNRTQLDASEEMQADAVTPPPVMAPPAQPPIVATPPSMAPQPIGPPIAGVPMARASSNWQTMALVAGAGAVLCFVLLAAIGALVDSGDNGNGDNSSNNDITSLLNPETEDTASIVLQGVIIQADVPGGWAWDTGNDGFLYIGSSNAIVSEAIGGIGSDFSQASSISSLRLANSGTIVGLSYGVDTSGLGMGASQLASGVAQNLQLSGISASVSTVFNSGLAGARITFGDSSYTRYLDVYELNAGVYIYAMILSDRYSTHESSVNVILSSIQVK